MVYGCEVYDTPITLILLNIKKCKDLKLILDFINGLWYNKGIAKINKSKLYDTI